MTKEYTNKNEVVIKCSVEESFLIARGLYAYAYDLLKMAKTRLFLYKKGWGTKTEVLDSMREYRECKQKWHEYIGF